MSTRVFIPRDSGALSVGAEKVARAIATEAAVRNLPVTIVRNGSVINGEGWEATPNLAEVVIHQQKMEISNQDGREKRTPR